MGIGSKIKDARLARGWSTYDLARASGVFQSAIHRIESKDLSVSKHIPALLSALSIEEQALRVIALVGVVGAGATILPMDTLGYVEAPPGVAGPETVAVLIKGDSMLPVYRDGDIIYYDRHEDPADLVGRDVVAELEDGRCMLKQIMPGTRPGVWTLLSHNAGPIVDVPVRWVARVRWVQKN